MSQRHAYVARLNSVIDHIDAHLADPLDLPSLAGIAHVSPWHFHRLFHAFTGETLAGRVRRRRVEAAALRLLASPPPTALAVALDVGFGSAEAFTRAFKAHFGVTPGAWRRGAFRDWAAARRIELTELQRGRRQALRAIEDALRSAGRAQAAAAGTGGAFDGAAGAGVEVELQTLPDARVAYMRHHGPYGDPRIARLWQRFDAWCRERAMYGPGRAVYGLSHDSPDITAPDRCRYDACIGIGERAVGPDAEVGVQTIAGGLYACARYRGTPERIQAAWMRLYAGWLPDSAWQLDDRAAIEAYGDAPSVDPRTGAFACELCLPVRAA